MNEGPEVQISLDVAGETYRWRGQVVRAEGAVDTRSRQLFVVAQIRNPYGRTLNDRPPLKIGSFIEAELTGKVVENVFVIPRSLLRENAYVLLVDRSDGRDVLRRRNVTIVWETDEVAVVSGGLKEGEFLCLTQVPLALEAYPVTGILESDVPKPTESGDGAEPVRRGPPSAASGGGAPGGNPAGALLAAIPADKPLPPALKAKLDAAVAAAEKGDRSQMRPIMTEIREWAAANGIELPAARGR